MCCGRSGSRHLDHGWWGVARVGPWWTNDDDDDDESDEFCINDDDDDGADTGRRRWWWVDGRRHGRRRLDGVLARAKSPRPPARVWVWVWVWFRRRRRSRARVRESFPRCFPARSFRVSERANKRQPKRAVSLCSRGLIFLLYPYIRERDPPCECGFDLEVRLITY